MKWVFWVAAAFVAYTYVGYALWLWVRSWLRPWPVRRGEFRGSVSVVMVVRNEERFLRGKIENLLGLEYPSDSWQIVVVSDGSTDATEAILRGYASNPRVQVTLNQISRGKACGLNDAMARAEGEIVVFTDARQNVEREAIGFLAENFADDAVGCVSGELMLGDFAAGEHGEGMGLYWRIEKVIRTLESASGSVVGATGALYALRRDLVVPVPARTILDDVYLPMHVVKQGFRVLFEPRARAWDLPNLGAEREFRRKVRTLSGNYQLLQLAPWMLHRENPLRFEFFSHKLMRLLVPFALIAGLVSTLFLPQPFYRAALALQAAFYGLALLGTFRRTSRGSLIWRAADAALTFVILNIAAAIAFFNFLAGRTATWTPGGMNEVPPRGQIEPAPAAEQKT
jgi:poly-beta-1,6-N-acetyl-D-glucosamine synthase